MTKKRNNKFAVRLSSEQQEFIDLALAGNNILVDACIGSGKTTSIQRLCDELPTNKKILYLTYNKLLKRDAKEKIKNKNVTVNNYHGFAFKILADEGISVGVAEILQAFLRLRPAIAPYDVLIIDEYQDIDQEISEMLLYIKSKCPNLQVIAVGDLCQKIYDYTTLSDISGFMQDLLDDPVQLEFTTCYRLSQELAEDLGRAWGKKIVGVNTQCSIERMSFDEAVELAGDCDPGDILCLGTGSSNGTRAKFQNEIENRFFYKFNKSTLWSSIREDGSWNSTAPKPGSAIFTTYDGSKGMERPIVFLCDYNLSNWTVRSRNPHQKHEVQRNIFLVAASRGKNRIIIVRKPLDDYGHNHEEELSIDKIAEPFETNHRYRDPIDVSGAFDFKYKEDVEACYKLIDIKTVREPGVIIRSKMADNLIDLSPCIGEYVEASYFSSYDTESQMKFLQSIHTHRSIALSGSNIQRNILQLTAQDTGQSRYLSQVDLPYVTNETTRQIHARLGEVLSRNEEVQVEGEILFAAKKNGNAALCMKGRCDAIKDDVIYELKFVTELQHTHFLQLACYLVMFGKKQGCLWNVRNDEMYEVTIPDRKAFMDLVALTITKRDYAAYFVPKGGDMFVLDPSMPVRELPKATRDISSIETTEEEKTAVTCICPGEEKYFAVIDIETNQSYGTRYGGRIQDGPMMSIGVVIADIETLKPVSAYYGIVESEARKPAWAPAQKALRIKGVRIDKEAEREDIISDVMTGLERFGVKKIAAYNAKFDFDHLQELHDGYTWIDIMGPCQYRQYNPFLPTYLKTFKTGKVPRGYKVDDLLKSIGGRQRTYEIHNALTDAFDELYVMYSLNHPVSLYEEFGTFTRKDLLESAPSEADLEKARAKEIEAMNAQLADERLNRISRNSAGNHRYGHVMLYGWIEDVRPDSFYNGYSSFTLHTKDGVHEVKGARSGNSLQDMQIVVVSGLWYGEGEIARATVAKPEEALSKLTE